MKCVFGFAHMLIVLLSTAVFADEIAVVIGPNTVINNPDTQKIADIFLKKQLFDDIGNPLIPLNLSAQDPVRMAFSQKVFNQLPEDMELYWNNQYFQGINPPHVLASEEAVLRFVGSTTGSIGYSLPCHIGNRAKIIFKLSVNESLNKVCKATK